MDEGLNCQVQKGEYYVDQGHCGLKKVIIIPGDELAQLIDECAKSQASNHRHQIVGRFVDVAQIYDQSNHHQHAAQEDMGDMQMPRAKAGISC